MLCRAACRPVHGHAGRLHIHQGQKGAALEFVDAHGSPLSAKGQHGAGGGFQGSPPLPSQRHGHVEAQAQVQAGVIQCLAEALLGFRAALEQAVQQALRAEHGIGVAAQVGHGVQFPQHGHELLPEAGLAPCPVLPQLLQRGLLRAGDVAPVAVRRVEAAVAVQGQALRLRRQGPGQRVDPGLYPRQSVRYPLLRQLLDVGEVEGGLELVPAGGEGQAGDLRPRAHQRPQGLAVGHAGRRDGEGAGKVHDVLGDVAGGFLLPGQFLFHAVEGFDVGQLHGQGLLAGVAHDQQHEAVAVEDEHGARLALLVRIFGRRKIALAEVFWAVTGYIAYVAENIGMPLAKKLGNFKRRGGRAAGVERDGRGKCFGNELGL